MASASIRSIQRLLASTPFVRGTVKRTDPARKANKEGGAGFRPAKLDIRFQHGSAASGPLARSSGWAEAAECP